MAQNVMFSVIHVTLNLFTSVLFVLFLFSFSVVVVACHPVKNIGTPGIKDFTEYLLAPVKMSSVDSLLDSVHTA